MPNRPENCPAPDSVCPADLLPKNVHVVSDSARKLHVEDMETLERHLGLVLSRVDQIASSALTPADISKAMRDGFVAALHDDATWAAAAKGIRTSAHREAGNLLVGALSGVFKKITLFSVAGLLVYWIGGWSALAAVWHAMFGGKP